MKHFKAVKTVWAVRSQVTHKKDRFTEDMADMSCFMAAKRSDYSKTCLKRPLKNRQNKSLKDKW